MRIPLLVAVALLAGRVDAAVIVTFHEPDKYADVGRYSQDPADNLKVIEEYLQHLGKTYLAPDRTLRIEVLDVDLAGEERVSMGSARDVRVLRDRADWPSVRLRYVVEADGKAVDSREETVSDMNYLMRPITRIAMDRERLPYEKRMLEEWFKARFGAYKPLPPQSRSK